MTVIAGCRARAVAAVLTASLAACTGIAASLAQDAPGDAIVARVDGQPVTEADLAAAQAEFRDIVEQMVQFGVDVRAELTQIVIELKLASQAAVDAEIDQDPVVAARVALARARVLYAAYLNQQIGAAVTDEAVQARFDQELAEFVPADQVHALHILVATEEEANAVIAELNQGGDFAAIARDRSTDPGSGPRGGDLDYIGRGETVQPFEDAAFALEVGAFSQAPVESQFGWHVIKVIDKRPEPPPTLEEERQRLLGEIASEARDRTIEALLDAAEIERIEPQPPDAGQSPPANP